MTGHEAVSTLYRLKNEILSVFKFLQKKVSRLDKRFFCIYWMNLQVLPHDFFQISTPKVVQKCAGTFFVKPGNVFLQKVVSIIKKHSFSRPFSYHQLKLSKFNSKFPVKPEYQQWNVWKLYTERRVLEDLQGDTSAVLFVNQWLSCAILDHLKQWPGKGG